jgi:DNA-binding MurR/RpiR family transcriptional regulator
MAAKLSELSPAEVRVAAFINEHAEDVAFLSVNDLARQLGSSDATIVRTAQALGYAGFPELRRELIDAVRERVSPAQIELLQQARRTVRPDSFEQAVDILDAAARILTFGIEAAGNLTATFALRLRRIGREALSISASGAGLALRSAAFAADSATGRCGSAPGVADRHTDGRRAAHAPILGQSTVCQPAQFQLVE